RLGFFGGLVAERAGLVDLGGQFLNPPHDPALLRQRRQWNKHFWNPFDAQDPITTSRAWANVYQLLKPFFGLEIIQEELRHAATLINPKRRITRRAIHSVLGSRH